MSADSTTTIGIKTKKKELFLSEDFLLENEAARNLYFNLTGLNALVQVTDFSLRL